ncbi:MAG: septum formation family protein, partial [Acidimicrobiia bacterium]|nr:septum formation family protein [Acidimicrobiia bacterium]
SGLITTPCSQPHDNEIYVIGTASGSYPGEIELNELADDFCLAEFEGFIGLSWGDSIYDFIWIVPDADEWETGERDVLCAAYDLDLAKLTGTLEGIGQ